MMVSDLIFILVTFLNNYQVGKHLWKHFIDCCFIWIGLDLIAIPIIILEVSLGNIAEKKQVLSSKLIYLLVLLLDSF